MNGYCPKCHQEINTTGHICDPRIPTVAEAVGYWPNPRDIEIESLRSSLAAAEATADRWQAAATALAEALEKIKQHQRWAAGSTTAEMSSTYRIADAALAQYREMGGE